MFSITAFAAPVESDGPDPRALKASTEQVQADAIRLLIHSIVLTNKVGEVVEITPETEAKYASIRNSVFASLPMGLVAAGTLVSLKQSAKQFESVLKPVTEFVKMLARAATESVKRVGQSIGDVMKALKVDVVLEKSVNSSENVWNFIKPVVRLFINKGVGISVLTISGAGVLSGSSFLVYNSTTKDALKNGRAPARSLLGYNAALEQKLDEVTADLSIVYQFGPEQKSIFKEALANEIIAQAVKTKFDRNAEYKIDAIEIVRSKNLAAPEIIEAALALRESVAIATGGRGLATTDAEILVQSIDIVTATSALLESYLQSGRLSHDDEKQVALMLYNAQQNLELVKVNLAPKN